MRNVPAALYKALGGFATNGVNITKLESYMVDGNFTVAQFYADIDGHPDQRPVRLALEELGFFSREVRILGVYPALAAALRAGLNSYAQILQPEISGRRRFLLQRRRGLSYISQPDARARADGPQWLCYDVRRPLLVCPAFGRNL